MKIIKLTILFALLIPAGLMALHIGGIVQIYEVDYYNNRVNDSAVEYGKDQVYHPKDTAFFIYGIIQSRSTDHERYSFEVPEYFIGMHDGLIEVSEKSYLEILSAQGVPVVYLEWDRGAESVRVYSFRDVKPLFHDDSDWLINVPILRIKKKQKVHTLIGDFHYYRKFS